MHRFRFSLFVFLMSFLLWSVVSWPLARYFGEGIPASPVNPTPHPPREMIAGDHLQLLYHLWLGHDTWFGPTPRGVNLYEFNVGDDEARRQYSTYYFPFFLFFGVGYVLGGLAMGWNVAALLSLSVSLGATVLWLRRWIPGRPWLVWCAALLGQSLPYRWHTLMNGSPTGLSLMWIPVILLGLDLWLRDASRRGAFLAGAGVFFSGWSDIHVIFFAGLLCAAWAPVNWLAVRNTLSPKRLLADVPSLLRSGWPLFIWVSGVLYQMTRVQASLAGTNVEAEGRQPHEVAMYSPHWRESMESTAFGGFSETYLGWGLAGLALLLLFLLFRGLRRGEPESGTRLAVFLVIVAGVGVTSLVATGLNNPWGELGWARLTRVIPPLGLLRQPAKIYLVLPPLVSLAAALGGASLPKRLDRIAAPLALLLIGYTLTARIHPDISLLHEDNQAYAHVAASSDTPRALALPLWPGDSHWSSLYMYYAKLHRIRMVNGYRPSRNLDYFENIFERFHVLSQGEIHDFLLDDLLERDIHHILLHENAFPERVSPFSVGYTLRHLLAHPRILYEVRDGPVWAFRILPEGETRGAFRSLPDWPVFGSVRWWDVVYGEGEMENIREAEAHQDRFARLRGPEHQVSAINFAISLPGDRRLWLRARGPGRAHLDLTWGGEPIGDLTLDLEDDTWRWHEIPLPQKDGFQQRLTLRARGETGTVDLDLVHLSHMGWAPRPAGPVTIPAPCFFRAGHTDLETDTVRLLPRRDPHDFIFYGLAVPLESGRYRVELHAETEAPAGTDLGFIQLRNGPEGTAPLRAGEPAVLEWDQPNHLLWVLEFKYNGSQPLALRKVVLTPLK